MKHTVSEIQITPIKPVNGLVAFASAVFDECLYLGSIGIYTRPQGGYRLTYPTRKQADVSLNIFHPINDDTRKLIEDAIIEKYEEIIGLSWQEKADVE